MKNLKILFGNIKKWLVLLVVFVFLLSCYSIKPSAWSGSMGEFRNIEIYGDSYVHSVKLLQEGLLCSRAPEGIRHAIFIPLKELNYKNLVEIQAFVIRNKDLKDLKNLYNEVILSVSDSITCKVYTGSSGSRVIRIGYQYEDYKVIHDCNMNNVKIDSLCILINNLIPNKNKDFYKLSTGIKKYDW